MSYLRSRSRLSRVLDIWLSWPMVAMVAVAVLGIFGHFGGAVFDILSVLGKAATPDSGSTAPSILSLLLAISWRGSPVLLAYTAIAAVLLASEALSYLRLVASGSEIKRHESYRNMKPLPALIVFAGLAGGVLMVSSIDPQHCQRSETFELGCGEEVLSLFLTALVLLSLVIFLVRAFVLRSIERRA